MFLNDCLDFGAFKNLIKVFENNGMYTDFILFDLFRWSVGVCGSLCDSSLVVLSNYGWL